MQFFIIQVKEKRKQFNASALTYKPYISKLVSKNSAPHDVNHSTYPLYYNSPHLSEKLSILE